MTMQPPGRSALKGTRGRIVHLLRRSGLTANEIGERLGLTHNAVRAQLGILQRDGLVREGGSKHSGTRPAVVYELVPEAESGFSKAYIPFVTHLVRVLQERLRPEDLEGVMRTVGRGLAADWPRVHGDLKKRVDAAAALLEELGSPNEVDRLDGGFVIHGYSSCMLARAVHGRPDVCHAIESLLAELLEVPVKECCERRGSRPLCCFEIGLSGLSPGTRRRARNA